MVKQLSSLGITNAGEAVFRSLKIPDLAEIFGDQWIANTVVKTVRMEAAKSVVITAIALKRFQLKHSRWPETLNELSPEFLPAVTIDIYDGKPLKYHPNVDGTYLLYCVGEDGMDNGGFPTTSLEIKGMFWQYQRARDWVWPQPATAEEIKDYYDPEAAKAAAAAVTESSAIAGTPSDPATGLPLPPPAPAGTN